MRTDRPNASSTGELASTIGLAISLASLLAIAGCGSQSGTGPTGPTPPGGGGDVGLDDDPGDDNEGGEESPRDAGTPPAKDTDKSNDEQGENDARARGADTPEMQGDAGRGDGRTIGGDAGMDGQGAPPDGAFRDGPVEDDGDSNKGPCGGGCPPDSLCKQNECKAKARLKCDAVENASSKGTLAPGQKITIKDSFSYGQPLSDALDTCAEQGGAEKLYRFKVSDPTQVAFKANFPGNFDGEVQFRKGGCRTPDTETCSDGEGTFFAPGGSTYYLVVESTANPSTKQFDVTIEGTPACTFGGLGDYGCKSGDRYLCEDVKNQRQPNEKKFACPTASGLKVGCQGGECFGDSCANPITIQASSGFSQSYTGDLASYSASMDFKDGNSSCKVQAVQASSRGPEVIYKVTGLQQGQTLEVKTAFPDDSSRDDPNSNLIYITNECKPPSKIDQIGCAETGNDIGDKPVTMEIDSAAKAGDYYIYIDKQSNNSNPFEYEISIK